MNSILVVDVGTSGVRAGVVGEDGTIDHVHYVEVLPSSPAPGFVEFDAGAMASAVLEVAGAALAAGGAVAGVGIANQRGSTIVWDRRTGEPVGPGIGWQDLRTVGTCLVLRDQGIGVAPNESATKLAMLLDLADPDRTRDLCFGTVDTWVAWTLSGGALHVTDATNAGSHGPAHPGRLGLGRHHARRAAHPPRRPPRHRRLVRGGGRGRRARPAHRSSAASPVTSRRRSSARAARGRGWRKPRSGRAACSTCAWATCAPASPDAAVPGRSPSWRGSAPA